LIGDVIGNYEIVEQIGKGGMGVVYLGQHTLLGRRAAIKVLLPIHSARSEIVSRFFNEARAVTQINDPGIVQVFDFGYHSDGSAFIVMELLEGDGMDRRLRKAGRLGVVEVLRLGRMICMSLGAAHAAGVVHRDLKPENIFVVRDPAVPGGERAKVLDFGIAKLASDQPGTHQTRTGALMGTPMYMSPEQCRGAGEVDPRSDIYAMGCVLFTMLTGRPPFEGDATGELIVAHLQHEPPVPSTRAPGLTPAVDQLVLRCLAKAPDARFQSMAELVWAIDAAELELQNERPSQPTIARTPPPPVRTPSPMPPYGVPTPPPIQTAVSAYGQTAASGFALPSVHTGPVPLATPVPGAMQSPVPGPTAASMYVPTPPPLRIMPTTLSTAFGETTPPAPARSRGWLAVGVVGALVVGGAIAIGAAAGRNARSHAAAAPEPVAADAGVPDAAIARPAAAPAMTVQPTPPPVTPPPTTPAVTARPTPAPTTTTPTTPPAPTTTPPAPTTTPPATRPPTTPPPTTVRRPPPPPIRGEHAKPTAPTVPFDRGD
jgi:serine/threonine-protein kinase